MPPRVVARACKSTVVTNNLQSAFGTQQVARIRKNCAGGHRRSLPEVDLDPLRASFETPSSSSMRRLCRYPAAWRFTPRKWTVEKEAQLQRTAQRTGPEFPTEIHGPVRWAVRWRLRKNRLFVVDTTPTFCQFSSCLANWQNDNSPG